MTESRKEDTVVGTKVKLKIWRGDAGKGDLVDYEVEANEGGPAVVRVSRDCTQSQNGRSRV